MSKPVRTRFAPSPTGYMHVGNLRTALYAYLLAKKSGGTFILRIEDTDQERYIDGAVDIIYATLRETGLTWDEGPDVGGPVGPYVQSERMGQYLEYAEQLIESGHAYRCFCDKETLEEMSNQRKQAGASYDHSSHGCLQLSAEDIAAKLDAGTPWVIRQRMPRSGTTTFHDEVFGDITVENAELEDQVLIKSDGMPTYNFANVVDDHLMGITHVVRGNEYLSSAPKYNLLYEAFGWPVPQYIHCAPVMKNATEKLSKRHGDASYQDLVAKGYLTGAVLNYVALLGWSPGGEEEIFTLDELAKVFDVRGISKSPAIFDTLKLNHINAEWIRRLSPEQFHELALPWIRRGVRRELDTAVLAGLLHARCELLGDIPEQLDFFDALPEYSTELYVHKKMKTDREGSLAMLREIRPVLDGLDDWSQSAIHDALFALIERLEVKNGKVLWPLRVAVSGKQTTPGGGVELAYLLGREETLRRLDAGMEKLAGELV